MLIDSHCHLNFEDLSKDIDNVLRLAKEAGVEAIVCVGTSLEDSKIAVGQTKEYPNVYSTVGIHPNDSVEIIVDSVNWIEFENLAKMPKNVAIGECGLDYSSIRYPASSIQYKNELSRQKDLLKKQIEIASSLSLPLSFHVRDAYEDMLEVVKAVKTPAVFHCFSGTAGYLQALLQNEDFYFSFAGNITFKNADTIRELAQLVPLDKILVETDTPFLAPVPLRGTINTPANVAVVAKRLAEIKNVSFEEICRVTKNNAKQIFNI